MRDTCERCGRMLALEGPALICSYECTFCTNCGNEMAHVCPNCSGQLVLRPPRAVNEPPTYTPDRQRTEPDDSPDRAAPRRWAG